MYLTIILYKIHDILILLGIKSISISIVMIEGGNYMGLIKAISSAIGGSLADSWLEVIEPDDMGDNTVFTSGVMVRKDDRRGSNRKGTADTISNGSIIHVYPNQFMMLVDGGKVVDYTAEEGYYKVDNSSLPSLFNGTFKEALKESFERIKFGGVTPTAQKVFYINLQEIKGIKFGTPNPLNYFDDFYNSELFLRTHGNYSIKITDPLLFFREAIPRNMNKVEIQDINEQYLSEFLEALQSAMNQMSIDGIRISHVPSKGRELSKYMADILDEEWKKNRGMEVQAVGISSISYDDESKELINMRNKGAMLGDPSVREGYVQGSIARGIEAAGSNEGGAAQTFMGMGMGMQTSGGFMGAASASNQRQMEEDRAQRAQNNVKEDKDSWFCTECGAKNTGKFCSECGTKRATPNKAKCSNCGFEPEGETPKFCPECGEKF